LGGLFKPYGGNLWAARVVFTAALAAIKLSSEISGDHDSLNIQTNTNVTSTTRKPTEEELEHAGGFEGSADHLVAVHTNRGTVLARKVLHATNAWSSSLIPQLHGVLTPVRNQVIITKPVPLMWNFGLGANYGYEYFMQRPDGRIILGGMRDLSPTKGENSVDQEYLDTNISEALATYLPRHFPTDLSGVEVEKEWVGVLAFTPDRNPLVGSLAGEAFANQYIASGYSGHGMPLAFLVGKHISQCMMASLCDGGVEVQTISSNGCIPIAFSPARYGI
jgi:glycine/D-amino acid oxidase-like deaminating enzyme